MAEFPCNQSMICIKVKTPKSWISEKVHGSFMSIAIKVQYFTRARITGILKEYGRVSNLSLSNIDSE